MFMPVNHSGGIFLQLSGSDKSSPRVTVIRSRHGIFLRVAIKRRRRVLHHDAAADPLLYGGSRTRIHVIAWPIAGMNAPLFYRDQIVWIGRVILVLHRGRNFVIRLRKHVFKRSVRGVIAKSSKRKNLSHVFSENFSEFVVV